jgi:hypothetical protein
MNNATETKPTHIGRNHLGTVRGREVVVTGRTDGRNAVVTFAWLRPYSGEGPSGLMPAGVFDCMFAPA